MRLGSVHRMWHFFPTVPSRSVRSQTGVSGPEKTDSRSIHLRFPRGTEAEKKLLSLLPVTPLKPAPCPFDVTASSNNSSTHFSPFEFNQVIGYDCGATVSPDPETEGNISQLYNHICHSCIVAQGHQYQIQCISVLYGQRKGKEKLNVLQSQHIMRGNECVLFSCDLAAALLSEFE